MSELLYETRSLCSVCSLKLGRGFTAWKKAFVSVREGAVWLTVLCEEHGEHRTLYCSNPSFFKRIASYTLGTTHSSDIEDLLQASKLTPTSENHPLIVELTVWDGNAFMSDQAIAETLARTKANFPQNRRVRAHSATQQRSHAIV
jgi:hypothetical protein